MDLEFEFEEPSAFTEILSDFVQPETNLSIDSAIGMIMDNLPPNPAFSAQVKDFCIDSLEVAEQIPYDHPSILKLVKLLGEVHRSPRFVVDYRGSELGDTAHQGDRFEKLGEVLRGALKCAVRNYLEKRLDSSEIDEDEDIEGAANQEEEDQKGIDRRENNMNEIDQNESDEDTLHDDRIEEDEPDDDKVDDHDQERDERDEPDQDSIDQTGSDLDDINQLEVTRKDASRYTSFHVFAAHCFHRLLNDQNDPTWAIWTLQDAFEDHVEDKGRLKDAYTMAAAHWILIHGDAVIRHIRNPPSKRIDWVPGPRYQKALPWWIRFQKRRLTLRRWHFWEDSFRAVARGGWDMKEGRGYSPECKDLSARAADRMVALEHQRQKRLPKPSRPFDFKAR